MPESVSRSPLHMANAFDPQSSDLPASTRELNRRREGVLAPSYRLFYRRPVVPVSAKGVWITDESGDRLLDAYNNVPVIGHSHPAVQEAVARQLGSLNTHTRYLTPSLVDYSERLLALFSDELTKVVYTCTGSEAVDLALRIARYETGARGIICTSHAYHGTTTAAAEISPSLGPNNVIGPDVVLVDAPDILREDPATAGQAFADRVREAIETLRERGTSLAGMIVDSVLSSDGVQTEPAGLLAPAAAVVREAGGLWIADEVQSGFGRLGHGWWGFTRHGLAPDLVVLGKPMGNGIPIAAVVGTDAVLKKFGRDIRYFNTFAASPVAIAAAAAVLDVIEGDGLIANADRTGMRLRDGMRALQRRYPAMGDVRGSGLFVAAEIVTDPVSNAPDPAEATRLVNGLRERHVLISSSGARENVLKIRPPLPFDAHHADTLITALDETLANSNEHSRPPAVYAAIADD